MEKCETVELQSNIDRRVCSRVKPMQVLVLGLCRTGTLCALVKPSPASDYPIQQC